MVNRLPQVKPKDLVKVLEKLGFVSRRQTGSHLILRHPLTKKITTVPIHSKDIKRGLLFGILKQAGISNADFLEALGQ